MIKIYLDDERETPEGWYRTYTAPQTITLLEFGKVEALSLDHDLGSYPFVGTGYDVLLWLEENPQFAPENINVHSANVGAWKKMNQAIESIERRKNGDK